MSCVLTFVGIGSGFDFTDSVVDNGTAEKMPIQAVQVSDDTAVKRQFSSGSKEFNEDLRSVDSGFQRYCIHVFITLHHL